MTALPDEDELAQRLTALIQFWHSPRNEFIDRVRKAISGENPIVLPKAEGYTPVAAHAHFIAAVAQHLQARFGDFPRLAVLPLGAGISARKHAERMEAAINSAFYEMGRRGDLTGWSMAALDVAFLSEGVIRLDAAPSAFWPDLVPGADGKNRLEMAFEDDTAYRKASEAHKRKMGPPFRLEYVPLERFYPEPGRRANEAFEVSYVNLRSLITNPYFDTTELEGMDPKMGVASWALRQQVMLVRYSNLRQSAYYASLGTTRDGAFFPAVEDYEQAQGGMLIKLREMREHGLNRLPYVRIPGRFGAWEKADNEVEFVTNAMLEVSQTVDELYSQGITNVRRRYWGSLVAYYSPEYRSTDEGLPEPPNVDEGKSIALWADERLESVPGMENDPLFGFVFGASVQQLQLLGASPAIFGQHQPGVDNGYQHNLQISQAESLQAQLERGLAYGAIDMGTLLLEHVLDIGEVVPIQHHTKDRRDRKYAEYVDLDPKDLDPMPILDAQVVRPRPIDKVAALRAALDATTDRGDKGPLLSDDTVRDEFLIVEDAQLENRKIKVEGAMNKAYASGVLNDKILAKLNLLMARGMAPAGAPNMANADPALVDSLGLIAGESAQMGGIDPGVVQQTIDRGNNGGGNVPGTPQPEQQVARAAANVGAPA